MPTIGRTIGCLGFTSVLPDEREALHRVLAGEVRGILGRGGLRCGMESRDGISWLDSVRYGVVMSRGIWR